MLFCTSLSINTCIFGRRTPCFLSQSVERQLVSTHFDTSGFSNKTETTEKRMLFFISHFGLLKKAQSILKFISRHLFCFILFSFPIRCSFYQLFSFFNLSFSFFTPVVLVSVCPYYLHSPNTVCEFPVSTQCTLFCPISNIF